VPTLNAEDGASVGECMAQERQMDMTGIGGWWGIMEVYG